MGGQRPARFRTCATRRTGAAGSRCRRAGSPSGSGEWDAAAKPVADCSIRATQRGAAGWRGSRIMPHRPEPRKQARRRPKEGRPTAEQPAPCRLLGDWGKPGLVRADQRGPGEARGGKPRLQPQPSEQVQAAATGRHEASPVRQTAFSRSVGQTRLATPQCGPLWRVRYQVDPGVPCALGNAVSLPESTDMSLFFSTGHALGWQ